MAYEQIATVPKYTTLSIPTSGWSGSGPWTRTVSITGGTASSMIDIQSSEAVINTMIESGTTALCIKNNNGAFTLVAMGAIPNAAITLQVSITEVTLAILEIFPVEIGSEESLLIITTSASVLK